MLNAHRPQKERCERIIQPKRKQAKQKAENVSVGEQVVWHFRQQTMRTGTIAETTQGAMIERYTWAFLFAVASMMLLIPRLTTYTAPMSVAIGPAS
jgi:hypothetical protein